VAATPTEGARAQSVPKGPSTMLRIVPLPRFAGEDLANGTVLPLTLDCLYDAPSTGVFSVQAIHTPMLSPRYWGLLSIASVFGADVGDFVSHDLHGGHWRGLAPMAVGLAAILLAERNSKRPTEIFYWLAIITVRTAATNLADLGTHDGQLPYGWVVVALALLLAALAALTNRRTTTGALPATGNAYWLGMLIAGTLGTAIGDGTADALGLGVAMGTVVLGAITAVLFVLRAWPAAAITAGYWVTVVAVRAAGTTMGDWSAHTIGLEVGTLCSGLVFIAGYLLLPKRRIAHLDVTI
jgi:uncharacterized membrane-anchored protein